MSSVLGGVSNFGGKDGLAPESPTPLRKIGPYTYAMEGQIPPVARVCGRPLALMCSFDQLVYLHAVVFLLMMFSRLLSNTVLLLITVHIVFFSSWIIGHRQAVF